MLDKHERLQKYARERGAPASCEVLDGNGVPCYNPPELHVTNADGVGMWVCAGHCYMDGRNVRKRESRASIDLQVVPGMPPNTALMMGPGGSFSFARDGKVITGHLSLDQNGTMRARLDDGSELDLGTLPLLATPPRGTP